MSDIANAAWPSTTFKGAVVMLYRGRVPPARVARMKGKRGKKMRRCYERRLLKVIRL